MSDYIEPFFNGSMYLGLWKPHIQFRDGRWEVSGGMGHNIGPARTWVRERNWVLSAHRHPARLRCTHPGLRGSGLCVECGFWVMHLTIDKNLLPEE